MAVLNPLREPCIYLRQTYVLCCRIVHGYTAACLDFCCCLFLCLDKQFRNLCFCLVKEPKPIKAQNHLIKENLKGRERSQTDIFFDFFRLSLVGSIETAVSSAFPLFQYDFPHNFYHSIFYCL